MKAHDVFPSKWLAASDLNGSRPVVTIDHVDWATFNDGSKKRAVYFVGKDKALTLNVTNWNMIAEITGCDDDEEWAGHKIRLVAAKVPFQGKIVDALRVEYPPAEAAPAKGNGKMKPRPRVADPDPEPEIEQDVDPDLGDDEVPF